MFQPVVHGPLWQLDRSDILSARGVRHKKQVMPLLLTGLMSSAAIKLHFFV